jgi:sarcosine oxidase subunit beta
MILAPAPPGKSQRDPEGYVYAVGMCGQGYMLGPGVGTLLTRMVQERLTPEDQGILEEPSPYREFAGERKEKLR